jgi:hypothetical protein
MYRNNKMVPEKDRAKVFVVSVGVTFGVLFSAAWLLDQFLQPRA